MDNTIAIKTGKKTQYLKYCVECGKPYTANRVHSLYCSERCRQRHKNRKTPHQIELKTIKQAVLNRFKFQNSTVLLDVKE